MSETSRPETSAFVQANGGPFKPVLDLLSNIWFGVTLVALIFFYCAIGSAGPEPVEVLRYRSYNVPHMFRHRFELTEMEWFSWWPFLIMIGLLVLALITVTLRKIPLRVVNLGVWMIHAGIIIMCVGCVIYFSQKLEGDVAVYRRSALITAPGAEEPVRMPIRPGATATIGEGANAYHVTVSRTNPEYVLLSGPDEGKTTFAAYLDVHSPTDHFTRQILVGYPDKTEDFRPGQGRTKGLIDSSIDIQLDYAPVDHFYVMDTAALYAREVGDDDWTILPIHGLPRYYEHIASRSQVWLPHGFEVEPSPLDIRLEATGAGKLPGSITAAVTGFVPFAQLQDRWMPGGDRLNPVLGLAIDAMGKTHRFELSAFDPRRNTLESEAFPIHFTWVRTAQELASLAAPSQPRLHVVVPEASVDTYVSISELQAAGRYEVPGTAYTLRFVQALPWTLVTEPHRGERAFLAMVEVSREDTTFTRSLVHPYAELTQDVDSAGQRHGTLIDERIELTYEDPAIAGMTLAAGPEEDALVAIYRRPDGRVETARPKVGEPFVVSEDVPPLTVDYVHARAEKSRRPALIPPEQRDTKARQAYSMIRVELASASGWTDALWLSFSLYAHPGRFPYEPRQVVLPNGTRIELLYSREQRLLPTAVALESFELPMYPGAIRERDYVSHVRFQDGDEWGEVEQVRSNQPGEHDGYWFFQSTWDPPDPSRGYAGMNYTGLGVGTRDGVLVMLAGTVLAIIGMIYAFYIKPIIKRQQRLRVLATVQSGPLERSVRKGEVPTPAGVREPAEVS